MEQFIPIYLLFIVMCYMTYKYFKQKKGVVYGYILLIYTISSFCSVMYVHTDFFAIRNKLVYDITYWPFVFWLFAFWIITRPLEYYDENKNMVLSYPINIIQKISIIGFVLCLIPFIEMLPKVHTIFNSSNLAVVLADAHDNDEKDLGLSFIGNTCLLLLSYGYSLLLLCILPLLKNIRNNRFYLSCILCVVVTVNMAALINSTRGVLVGTILDLGLAFVLYLPWLSSIERKKIIKYLSFFLATTITIFIIITVARNMIYSESIESITLTTFIFQYAGEGFVNFNQYMDKIINHTNGDYCFYPFKSILGFDVPETYRGFLLTIEDKIGIRLMIFYTFIGFFVIDIGYVGTLIVFSIIAFFVSQLVRNRKCIEFHTLYILYFYTSAIAYGTTLYKYSWGAGKHIIFAIFVYIILKRFGRAAKKKMI